MPLGPKGKHHIRLWKEFKDCQGYRFLSLRRGEKWVTGHLETGILKSERGWGKGVSVLML